MMKNELPITTSIMIMNSSKKRSIQARVARAILVMRLFGHRRESLKRGVVTLGGSSLDQAWTVSKRWKQENR